MSFSFLVTFALSALTWWNMDDFSVHQGPWPKTGVSHEVEISDVATFNQMPGLTFDYPVFKEWEIKSIEKKQNEYRIMLNWPEYVSFAVAPQISIWSVDEKSPVFKAISATEKSASGVFYEYIYLPGSFSEDYDPKGYWNGIHFFTKNSPQGVLITLNIGTSHGFSKEIFAEKVIETLQFR